MTGEGGELGFGGKKFRIHSWELKFVKPEDLPEPKEPVDLGPEIEITLHVEPVLQPVPVEHIRHN